jgi:hypothetical protein
MFMRRRRPLLRAAALGGGAYAMGRAGEKRRTQADARSEQPGSPQAPRTPPAPPQASGHVSVPDQLSQLATLHSQGALTDQEFAVAKARLLGNG